MARCDHHGVGRAHGVQGMGVRVKVRVRGRVRGRIRVSEAMGSRAEIMG